MKYLIATLGLLLFSPLAVSAASCNSSELAHLYNEYQVNYYKAEYDRNRSEYIKLRDKQDSEIAQLATPTEFNKQNVIKKYAVAMSTFDKLANEFNTKFYTARQTADKACETLAQDKVEQEKQLAEREAYLTEMRTKNAATQAEIARSNAALYANQPTQPVTTSSPTPVVTPKVATLIKVIETVTSTPTTTEPIVQEQVEVQQPVVETVPTPEPVKKNVVFKVLRSISNFFKKLW